MPIKQPYETMVLTLAFGQALASIDSVAVVAAGLVPGGAALVADGGTIAGAQVLVAVSGGADGERYVITARAAGAGGQLLEREADLAVVDFTGAVPALAGPYLSAQAFVDRLGLDETQRLTDINGNGRIDAARLQGALNDAQAEADGYLAARFVTPLSAVPALVAMITYDLAVARLYVGDLPASVADRRDRAQAQLRDIAKGVITIPGAAGLAPADASPEPVLFQGSEPLFTRESLKRF